ncbi:LEAF RUST 10 DISEASE-RESISTANCE LOCUS RECEPTOR-LIKE PROTEIN KINASE-like 1.2 isoform X2 [Quercus lobata]|uniref:LEAF RUST 10 DISEASE-RESISTANCE LOCUS RECEPTOR-LIKE PROTEIN KINASE-like 1.2 isoform X2 n=1 Tax=Quercus lobata TaxID=97700 RepID=UPI001248C274|nr:LEAF RUST 10 DISEASE-RESISTANCE LOCUS RECEPTOR-LIKE PROTEIN KINASE-like 1.2 isoform X2 [Quercus lobata]
MSQFLSYLLIVSFFFFFFNSIGTNSSPLLSTCAPRYCGNVMIGYPFRDSNEITSDQQYCGYPGFGVRCENGKAVLGLSGDRNYYVKDINYTSHTLTLVDIDVTTNQTCPRPRQNFSLETLPLKYSSMDSNLSFYSNCYPYPPTVPVIPCLNISSYRSYVFVENHETEGYDWSKNCEEKVVVTVRHSQINMGNLTGGFGAAMNDGFVLDWERVRDWAMNEYDGFVLDWERVKDCVTCEHSHGYCGYNATAKEFLCICKDGSTHSNSCKDKQGNKWWKYVLGAVSCLITVVLILGIIFLINRRRMKKKYDPSILLSRSISYDPSGTTDQERGSSYFGVHLFTYNELEEATNNFDSAKELGDGGFGTVYYGILRDGRQVAVKRLYEHNCRRVEQFMNEVEILTRLRHPNLVSLYGCTSRTSRELLLVYEYIPNGTVADHLHGDLAKPGALPFPTRMKIAVETATALAYLHASDIIHRDVKTNNILLDNNFLVKVADFGLSRLFPTDVTHVSTAPQGTPGYVDPEYHECYQLTEKSDVFSFGVVLIELISSMPAVDISRHRHEINLSNMAMNKIQNHTLHELVDPSLGFESDCTVKNMITDVAELAFQCLQYVKEMRPSMAQVLEALKDIQHRDYIKDEEISISADDVVLLKSDPVPLSPDSALNWNISTSTTSNGSR